MLAETQPACKDGSPEMAHLEFNLAESTLPEAPSAAADKYSWLRRCFRRFVHWASHRFILSSKKTRDVRVGDLSLRVPPTVFHPGIFITSKIFADFLRCQDFRGRRVVEVGTGSGILAISAALAGAQRVLALDINPNAVQAAAINARANAVGGIFEARLSDLFSSVHPDENFDVVVSSPPSFEGDPRDIADRAWVAGAGYEHLQSLFRSAYAHLNADGEMFLLLSSDTNIALMKTWACEAGFAWHEIGRKSIWIEHFIVYHLVKGNPQRSFRPALPDRSDVAASYLRRRMTGRRSC